MHFSEIIKLQKTPYIAFILKLFTVTLVICFSGTFSKPCKNTFELVGTVLNTIDTPI